jgi:hypothetical protein
VAGVLDLDLADLPPHADELHVLYTEVCLAGVLDLDLADLPPHADQLHVFYTEVCLAGVLDLDLADLPPHADQLHVAAKYLGDHVAELRTPSTFLLLKSLIFLPFWISPWGHKLVKGLWYRTFYFQKIQQDSDLQIIF